MDAWRHFIGPPGRGTKFPIFTAAKY